MKIGIIGGGVVGRATARTYLGFVDEVRVYDLLPERSTAGLHPTLASDLVFVCLPEDVLDGFFGQREVSPSKVHYVLKSTVPIGTTRRLAEEYRLVNLVHSPEFLTARCADTDAKLPSRNIIGEPAFRANGYVGKCGATLEGLYLRRFPGIPCRVMSSDESEAVKLFTNSLFAVKVSLFNELRALADKLSLDWDAVLEGILSDGRIAPYHYQVPGPDGQRGFGGACLPKDVATLRRQMSEAGVDPYLLTAALCRNVRDRPLPVVKGARPAHPRKPKDQRTVAEVMAARDNGPLGSCCDRFANYSPCNCLEVAEAYEKSLRGEDCPGVGKPILEENDFRTYE